MPAATIWREQARFGIGLSDRLAHPAEEILDGHAGLLRRADRFRLRGFPRRRGAVAVLLRQVEVRQDVEEAGARRFREERVVAVVERLHPLAGEAGGRGRRIVDPAAVHPVHRAQDQVPVGPGQPARERLLVSFGVVGLETESDLDGAPEFLTELLDLADVTVELVLPHREPGIAIFFGQEVERNVVREADLRKPHSIARRTKSREAPPACPHRNVCT